MGQIANIEFDDMKTMIHGLKMSGLAFVEPDALDPINDRIKNLPTSEELGLVYSQPKEIKRLCAEVGAIMELIDHYGTKNEEYKSRYKAKTKLPPRHKVLKWKEEASSNMKVQKEAQGTPEVSTTMEAAVQQTKDIGTQLDEMKVNVEKFSNDFRTNMSELNPSVPPQFQAQFQQHYILVDNANKNLLESTNSLKLTAQTILQTGEMAGQALEAVENSGQSYTELGGLPTTSGYIKDIVRLSGSLEGNGLISGKLLTYAKNLRDGNPQAIYDAKEVTLLLRHANLKKEAGVFVKTAGIWDTIKDVGKGAFQGAQGGLEQSQEGKSRSGVIDPGTQTGQDWQTGDEQTQFTNDVDWLKRSWVNLVNFFERYERDSNILKDEWANSQDAEKVKKVTELSAQATNFLAKANEILASENFSAKLMGDNLLGGAETTDPTVVGPDNPPTEPTEPTEPTQTPEQIQAIISQAQQILAPFLQGDWANCDWEKISELLDAIDAERQFQNAYDERDNHVEETSDAMFRERGAYNASKIITAQNAKANWDQVGVDLNSPALNMLMTGKFKEMSSTHVNEVREIVKKIKTSLGIGEPVEPPVEPPVDPANPEGGELATQDGTGQENTEQGEGSVSQSVKEQLTNSLRENVLINAEVTNELSTTIGQYIEAMRAGGQDLSGVNLPPLVDFIKKMRNWKISNQNLVEQFQSRTAFNLSRIKKIAATTQGNDEMMKLLHALSGDLSQILNVDLKSLANLAVQLQNIQSTNNQSQKSLTHDDAIDVTKIEPAGEQGQLTNTPQLGNTQTATPANGGALVPRNSFNNSRRKAQS